MSVVYESLVSRIASLVGFTCVLQLRVKCRPTTVM